MSDVPATDQQPLSALLHPDASATEQTVPEASSETAPGGGDQDTRSVIETLRERRNQLGLQAKPLDIPVPGYDGLLILRCRWVAFKDLSAGARELSKIKEPTEAQIHAAADTLVVCCQDFLIKVGDEIKPIAEDGTPTVFGDPRLPASLGFSQLATAVDVARAVFNNEYALIRTANTVIEWLQDTTKRVDTDILGN
jgi:hypothetical protein